MCGIAGFVDLNKKSDLNCLLRMTQTLNHRGPNDEGTYIHQHERSIVGLGHKRLSILDLSPAGHQPMQYNGLIIVYNGEVYNFKEIKKELRELGHSFHSNSDTEVILHAYEEWREACVYHFIGMFAFAILETHKNKLMLCRNRAGVKPLFYYWKDGLFLFGSELKAFHHHPGFNKELNKDVLPLFLNYGYIPAPYSIFQDTFKLDAGHWLHFDLNHQSIETNEYWSLLELYRKPVLDVGYQDATTELESIMQTAFEYRMISDVPGGVFLRCGFDSTLVTALLQKDRGKRINTFTIGFPTGVDEAPHARKIAHYLGTNHTEYNCTEEDAKSIIPELSYYYDEPCADISCIPTILVSRLAQKKVSVALSADGGDEMFSGYTGFQRYIDHLNTVSKLGENAILKNLLLNANRLLPQAFIPAHLKKKLNGIRHTLKTVPEKRLQTLVRESSIVPDRIVSSLMGQPLSVRHPFFNNHQQGLRDERSFLLLNSFVNTMTDLLLVKVDRATMSTSLESREPMLDHRIIEFAAQLPYEYKHDGYTSKKKVREILYQYVPKELMNRPKTGFDLPIFAWLKDDLSHLLDQYLNKEALERSDCFNALAITKVVRQFKAGKIRYNDIIWRLLVFQLWFEHWINE